MIDTIETVCCNNEDLYGGSDPVVYSCYGVSLLH